MNQDSAEETLINTIIQLIQDKNPRDVEQLADLAAKETSIPKEEIVEHILRLQNQGKIKLKKPAIRIPQKLSGYLKTEAAYWYWAIMILTAATTITVFTIPEEFYPIVYIRYVLGTVFVLWLPGYSFIKALFPTEPPFKTSKESLDQVERLALSIGMSLALVPLVGLLLNYTPWGIRLTPIVLSLLLLTTVFSTAAIVREHQIKQKP